MRWRGVDVASAKRFALALSITVAACSDGGPAGSAPEVLDPTMVAEGKEIFRHDTFGDEKYWTDTLRMHEVIQAAVSPRAALGVGLKVDAAALPASVRSALAAHSGGIIPRKLPIPTAGSNMRSRPSRPIPMRSSALYMALTTTGLV